MGANALRPRAVIESKACRPSSSMSRAGYRPTYLESLEDAAEIAGIETEFSGDIGRGRLVAPADFVEDARFGEREHAAAIAFLQNADTPRVEAVELADREDGVA